MTQKKLAERLGVTQQALSLLEKDPSVASVSRIFYLLSALDVELVLREKRAPKKTSEW
jgi:HTH-type transcriptional regulator/antitoxin HipB